MGEKLIQPPKLLFVNQSVTIDPRRELLELCGIQSDGAPLRITRSRDKSGVLEHLDVTRHGLLRHLEWFCQFIHRGRTRAQSGDDLSPSRVRQSEKRGIESLIIRIRHNQPISLSTF